MQKITMQDLEQIHCLSQVACSPDGSSVAFVVTRASLDKNTYLSNLWLWENGSCRKLTSGDKESDLSGWMTNICSLPATVSTTISRSQVRASPSITASISMAARLRNTLCCR